jgi:multiple sugar transport system permease protein
MRTLEKTFDRLVLVALVVLTVVWIAPIVWIVGLSLKPNELLSQSTRGFLLPPFTLRNYVDVFTVSPLLGWMLNSAIVAVGQTILTLVIASLAGYGFARTNFPGKTALFVIVLAALAVPEQAIIAPLHAMFTAADLHNTYTALIVPRLAFPFGVLLMTQYFQGISPEVEEAALLDNASRFLVFWRIVLPLSIPAQATLGIYTFLRAWNDFFWPLVSVSNPDFYTLTIGLASLQMGASQPTGIGWLMAHAVIAGLPVVILYLFFQRHIVGAVAEWSVR